MDKRLQNAKAENVKRTTKLVQEGEFVVAVDVDLIETETGWGPYLSLADAKRLDETHTALQNGDLKEAEKYGKLYRLTPLSA